MKKFSELRDSGLLWWINKTALHPHGLALGLQFDNKGAKGEPSGWQLYVSDDGEWQFAESIDGEGREKFDKFLQSLQESDSIDLNKEDPTAGFRLITTTGEMETV